MENIEKKRQLEEEEKALINSNETQISEPNPSEHICRKVSEQCFDILQRIPIYNIFLLKILRR